MVSPYPPHEGTLLAHPPALALISGKGGVGRSSLALNLAIALGVMQEQVLLVDADPTPGHLALLAGVESGPSLLATGIAQAQQLACGVDLLQIFAGAGEGAGHGISPNGPARPLSDLVDGPALQSLESRYHLIIVDTGPGIDLQSMAAARAADAAWVVLTPELTAVADGYATIKHLLSLEPGHPVGCLVNAAESEQEAEDVQGGFVDLIGRFLGAQIDIRGYIPLDRTVREAAKGQSPFCLEKPSTPAAVAVADLASELTERRPIVTHRRHRAYLEGVADLLSVPVGTSLEMSPVQEPLLIV